jgi:hypothetical protein
MASARWGSSMMALSVISRQKAVAATPWRCRMSSRRWLRSGSSRSRVDRLTDTRTPSARAWGCACQRAAASKTHSVSWRTKPVCSAKGMNCMGGTRPRCGCCQRTRASAARVRWPCSATLGCKNRRSSSCSTARRRSPSKVSVCALEESSAGSYICTTLSVRLAAYMAISARLSSPSASAAWPGQQAMPRAALRSTVCSFNSRGASKACTMVCAAFRARVGSAPCSSSANSLPPTRATRSGAWDAWGRRRWATACSRRSPKA